MDKLPEERATVDTLPAVELIGVGHIYGDGKAGVKALRDINMSVKQNEFVVVIGPSGCGKSTMLFIIAGLIQPSTGSVFHLGEPITGWGRERGLVFQADAVFPWLTVYQNIEFGPRINGVPKAERDAIVRRYIDLVELGGFEHRWPKELSGGMRKRVDLARTYANDPDVLLLDEPFGSLDMQTKERMQIQLLHLWDRYRKTAILITHDVEEAIFLADRVMVMTERPGTIHQVVDIPFKRPREADLKVSSEFGKLRIELTRSLEGK